MTSNGSASYSYNAENQISLTGGYAYFYNGDGQRVKEMHEHASILVSDKSDGNAVLGRTYPTSLNGEHA